MLRLASPSAVIAAVAATVLLGCGGCAGSGTTGGGGDSSHSGAGSGSGGSGGSGRCEPLRDHVESVYAGEESADDPQELRLDLRRANVEMVLTDCSATAAGPGCVEGASSVTALEACLIPLDDEGRVEASLFGSR